MAYSLRRRHWNGRIASATLALWLIASCDSGALSAAEPFRFAEAEQAPASLKYYDSLPLLVVTGTSDEMGQQIGALTHDAIAKIAVRQDDLVRGFGMVQLKPLLMLTAKQMWPQFPPNQQQEMTAIAKASGIDLNFLIFGNVVYDYSKIGGCSVLMAERQRSTTGGLLFGRNFDFPTFGVLDQISLVTVYRAKGKHAFVSVGFPGMIGCVSGMNDVGLSLAELEVNSTGDRSAGFNAAGVPLAMCFRRMLEDCATVDEAETLLRSLPRSSMCNLAIADRQHAAVLEITTKNVVRRGAESGVCACTNHFRTPELATSKFCRRYPLLDPGQQADKLGLDDLAHKLDQVNQGGLTIQTMIFEPQTLKLHLSLGKHASSRPLKVLDLSAVLGKPAAP